MQTFLDFKFCFVKIYAEYTLFKENVTITISILHINYVVEC